jgi:hypothetical protein
MDISFLVIDFIIFTAAAILGFIWGAMWVDSEFERDSAYLSAEVENLNKALDALSESYNQLTRENGRILLALERSVDAHTKLKDEIAYKKSPQGLREAVDKAWRESHDDRDI